MTDRNEVIFEIAGDVDKPRPSVFRAVIIEVDENDYRSVRDILEFPFTARERTARHIARFFENLQIHMQHHDVDFGRTTRLDSKFVKIMESMV